MKKKRLKNWIKAIDYIIEEYKEGRHDSRFCNICIMADEGNCNKCILKTGDLTCADMPTFQATHGDGNNEFRIKFYENLKKEILNMRGYNPKLSLRDIQAAAWVTELELLMPINK